MEKRRLSAIMFTDIVGYTKKMGDDEVKMLKLLRDHNAIVENATEQHDGEIIKRVGDAFLVRFESALNAVLCAIDVQQALTDYNQGKSESDQVHIRIGIHLGDIVISEGDVFGDGVNVASRIEPLAHPGGICITRSVYDIVKKKMTVKAVELGAQQLKNVDEAVDVFHLLSETIDLKDLQKAKRVKKQSRGLVMPFSLSIGIVAIILVVLWGMDILRFGAEIEIPQPVHTQLTFDGDAVCPAMSPDGKSFAYSHNEKVYIQDINGGEPVDIFTHYCIGSIKWSPDGSEILITAQMDSIDSSVWGVFIVPRLGGTERKIDATSINTWSPDAGKIAFLRGSSKDIFIVDKATGEIDTIFTSGDYEDIVDLDWSPSGKFILFSSTRESVNIFRTISIDGEIENIVISDSSHILSPRWAPEGDAIYYARTQGRSKNLMKINIDKASGKSIGKAKTLLTGLQSEYNYSFSGKGDQLIYQRVTRCSNLWTAKINPLEEDGHIQTEQLTKGTYLILGASISPDGKQIALAVGKDFSRSDIFLIPADGGDRKQITFLDGLCFSPVWSPDGQEIAFAIMSGGNPQIWKVNLTVGKTQQIETTNLSSRVMLYWAPNQNILYQKTGNRNFVIHNPETATERDLIQIDSVGWMHSTMFSHDLSKLALYWNRQPDPGLWIIPVKDSIREDLAKPLVTEGLVSPLGWSQDNNWIFAFSNREPTDRNQVLIVSSEDGKVQDSITLPLEFMYPLFVSPDDKTIICSVGELLSDLWMVEDFDPDLE